MDRFPVPSRVAPESPYKAVSSLARCWVVWEFSGFPTHLPANAFTLSVPIIIRPALLRAAIP